METTKELLAGTPSENDSEKAPEAVRAQKRSANTRKARAAAANLSESERERLRLALHDGLGQLLTSISFLGTSLHLKLASQSSPEAEDAREIVALTQRAISETQALVTPDSPAALR